MCVDNKHRPCLSCLYVYKKKSIKKEFSQISDSFLAAFYVWTWLETNIQFVVGIVIINILKHIFILLVSRLFFRHTLKHCRRPVIWLLWLRLVQKSKFRTGLGKESCFTVFSHHNSYLPQTPSTMELFILKYRATGDGTKNIYPIIQLA